MAIKTNDHHLRPGDRVRLPDGRILELAWPCWPFGLDPALKKIGRAPVLEWFAREVVDDFGVERRSEATTYPASMIDGAEIVSRRMQLVADDARGDTLDPLRDPARRGPLC